MRDMIYKLRDNADAVGRVTGWRRPNGMGLGPVGQHRDSDVLEQSNFAVILADLQAIDDRCESVSFGHWGVGWVEEILVPLTGPVADAVERWVDALADYPAADDEDLSEREYADAILTLTACYGVSGDDMAGRVFSWLFDARSMCRGEDYHQADVDEAKRAILVETMDELGLDEDDLQAIVDAA